MSKLKKTMKLYNETCYSFLTDYLLFSNDLDNDLKIAHNNITRKDFLKNFLRMLTQINNNLNYPKEVFKNATNILDYIKKNSDGLEEELNSCIKELENMVSFSNEKYHTEFCIKKNSFEEYKNTEYQIWNKEDIKKSIYFDYIVLVSFSANNISYIENYLPSFILSKNYIYALKKIIYVFPDIFKIKTIKNRVLQILEQDLELLNNYDEDIIKTYISQNYNLSKTTIEFNLSELEEFKKEIMLVLNQMNHLNTILFDIENFKFYYQQLYLEYYLYYDQDININGISLDSIYYLIEKNNKYSMIDNAIKKKLLYILNQKKAFIDEANSSLEEYNYFLVMLNEIEENKFTILDNFIRRSNFIDQLKSLYMIYIKNDKSLYHNIATTKKYDLGNFEAYLASDEEFECIKNYLKETKYPFSINRFLKEFPSMFTDETIYKRTIEVLESYDDRYSKKILKKLTKQMNKG